MDLYRAVRQGLRASVESYSIKRLEPLYGFERTVDLRDAGACLVEFETWLETAEEGGGDGSILEHIEGYNQRRLPLGLEAPRLARGAPPGAGREDRRAAAAARSRASRRRPRSSPSTSRACKALERGA